MKSKRGSIVFLYLIVTLLFIPISYGEEINKNSGQEERDNLILTEDMSSEDRSQDEVNGSFKASGKSATSNETSNESKEEKEPTYIDRKEAEINDRINSARKNETNSVKEEPMAELEPATSTTTDDNALNLSDEEFENVIKDVSIDHDIDNTSYDKAVSEALSKAHISKEDSKKITRQTDKIIEEYNQKIEAAESIEEKEALQKEAADKINQNLKESVSYLSKGINDDKNDIDAQKNEKLRIEVSPADDLVEKSSKKDKDKKVSLQALLKGPKLSQGKTRFVQSPVFLIAIIIILTLSASFAIALKKKEK